MGSMCFVQVKGIEYKFKTLYFMVKNTPAPIPSKANAWMMGHFSNMNMSNLWTWSMENMNQL